MEVIRTYDINGCKMIDRRWDNSKRIVYVSSNYEVDSIENYFQVLDLLEKEFNIPFDKIVNIKFKRHDKEYYKMYFGDNNSFCMSILYSV